MRLLLAGFAITLLAGCRLPASDAADSANQPSEAVVETELQNEQDSVEDNIANEAKADARNTTANADAADDDTPDRFACGKDLMVQVVYGADDGTARLTAAGKTMALLAADGASGGPYRTDDGITPGKSLTWSVRGTSATLVQAQRNSPKDSPGETIVQCEAVD
ncbi:MAG: MliC family protein [Candidatus Sphingomonas phytovorans]|nr:MliC family protein [Sphingomonas sp.]WEJ97803.1 MAG: MliC family protein [Sphingomonas sp.]